jgi:FlaA1/EpsC-like NDP-sugar epimerase
MHRQLLNRNFYIIVFADLFIFILALLFAYLMRFEFVLTGRDLSQIVYVLLFLIPIKMSVFSASNVYQGMWRYTGLKDVGRLVRACLVSSLAIMSVVLIVHRFNGFSRAVFILDGGLTFLLCAGLRVFIREAYAKGWIHQNGNMNSKEYRPKTKRNTLIVGAGNGGEKVLRELLYDNPSLGYRVVGFLDDDKTKWGRSLHGYRIFGSIDMMPDIVAKCGVEEVLLAIPSASGAQMRRIVNACESCQVRYKTLPGIGELINGKVSIKAIRDVDYQDLLGRPAVNLNVAGIEGYLKGKTVLVTGAGGSIGSELCRQILRFEPEQLVLLDASECGLYAIQMELKHKYDMENYVTILAAVQNQVLMSQVFAQYEPDVVFHAAAYKHVPMLERNPWQAIRNNVLGTRVLIECAIRAGVEKVVLVSTDKAVRPTNVMGASKRLCELLMHAYRGAKTQLMAVRFGNVVGSAGSVVPLFRDQIARGGPVTVTHPEMTRYFMTISEASKLILQAGSQAKGGEVFILEMGTPVKIVDMARDLIRLSGREPDVDIKIEFTGLRPGEKLYEELITEGEGIVPTEHDKIMVLRPHHSAFGFSSLENLRRWLLEEIDALVDLADCHDACAIKLKMQEIVPEYSIQDSECVLRPSRGKEMVLEFVDDLSRYSKVKGVA